MKKIKELFKKWFRKKNSETIKEVIELAVMPCPIVHPFDLMETLGITITFQTRKPIVINSEDILLFAVYDDKENFVGSFFCVEEEGKYFGNIVGTNKIIACEKDTFVFKKTDEIIYPMRKGYKLTAQFVYPEIIPQAYKNNNIVVHQFTEENTMLQALDYCLSYTE